MNIQIYISLPLYFPKDVLQNTHVLVVMFKFYVILPLTKHKSRPVATEKFVVEERNNTRFTSLGIEPRVARLAAKTKQNVIDHK